MIVVDPFRCVEPFASDASFDINEGVIDHAHLKQIVEACEFFASWSRQNEQRCFREFKDHSNHASILLGIGEGASIVRQIPGNDKWSVSWIRAFVNEVEF